MTLFDQLQAGHQQLLEESPAPADGAAFLKRVETYIDHVRDAAQDVPAPRDRDQLRANLRFWASYVYDKTGIYPNTTLRPAIAQESESAPQPQSPPVPSFAAEATFPPPALATPTPPPVLSSAPGWRTWLVAAIVLLAVGALFLWARANPQTVSPSNPGSDAVIVRPGPAVPGPALTIAWRVVTSGPSPFNPNVWVVRIELNATGGNGQYIFWLNGQRLPDVSNNQFTVESFGCQPVGQLVGVTSDGQIASQELSIYPPLSSCR